LALRELRVRLDDLDSVVYTHPHVDHMGGGSGLRGHLHARHHLPIGFDGGFHDFMVRSRDAVSHAYDVANVAVGPSLAREIAAYCESHLPLGQDLAGHPLEPGDRVPAGPSMLAAVPTPGHTAWCTTLVDIDQGIAFSGDLVVGGSTSFNAFLGSRLDDYFSSLDRLATLEPRLLLTGHGKPRSDPAGALERCRATMKRTVDSIVMVLTSGPASLLDVVGATSTSDTLHPVRFPIELGRALVALNWLAHAGECVLDESTGSWHLAATGPSHPRRHPDEVAPARGSDTQ
jgi:glyoxylase-like metal-dependent hydrolase (beta-lactamase superfamily II)